MYKLNRTVVNMANKNALITKAILASYIDKKHMDYLKLIEPFIIVSLNDKLNSEIDISNLTTNIYNTHGIKLRQKIIEKILIRLSKNKIIKINTSFGKNKYILVKSPDTKEFYERKEKMNEIVFDIVEKLKDFYNIIVLIY